MIENCDRPDLVGNPCPRVAAATQGANGCGKSASRLSCANLNRPQVTQNDARRLEGVTLPAVRRKRDRTRARLARSEIGPGVYLGVQRDTSAIVRYHRETLARHRRDALRLNTALGVRMLR
jgi:hypothetical protein